MIIDFGFDLAGRGEPRLRRSLIWSGLVGLIEAVPYIELCRVLSIVFAGRATIALAVEAAAVLLLASMALVVLRGRSLVESFESVHFLVADMRLRVADHLGRLPMGFFSAARRGAIAENLSTRFNQYQDIITHAWSLSVANAALPLALWMIMLFIDWRIATIALLATASAMFAIPWSYRRLDQPSVLLADMKDDVSAQMTEFIDGQRDLRQFDYSGSKRRSLEALMAELERGMMRNELAPAPAILAFGTTLQVGFAASVVVAALLLAAGLTSPTPLLIFLVLALRYFRAVRELGIYLVELRVARSTLARIRTLLEDSPLPEATQPVKPRDSRISIDSVCFSYGEGLALDEVSVRIKPGTVTALVGPSGSGKSTLAHLIARLWDVDGGAISIGGADLRAMSAETLNRTVSMVLQDVVLFEDSVLENLRLGRPTASEIEVQAAARAARAHDFIMRMPEGYATRLRGAGVALSSGERQRLAIARALLKDAPVLILDEATANIDFENEAEIQAALSTLVKGRTLILIAHRLWTARSADQILVLSGGRITARGTHDELLRSGGLYHSLWTAQQTARSWRLGVE